MRRIFFAFVLLNLLIVFSGYSDGVWNNQDSYHVPMSWCVYEGSPADTNPNITSADPPFQTDTTTDALIWRRHERPTDFVYADPAGITFRSAINNTWGSLNFPIIDDNDTGDGVLGDMRGEDVNVAGDEYNQAINDCDAAWDDLGRAGIGVTAINVGLFHDDGGDYVGVIGWGGCSESDGNCITPYDGRIVVIDNNYRYPTVTDRTFPPSPADPPGDLMFTNMDQVGQLVGHELGHALSLNHRTNNSALMNPTTVDTDGDNLIDNISLNAGEVSSVRNNALKVAGVEIDPPGEFNPGRYVATRLTDRTRETEKLPKYLDLASVRTALDKDEGVLVLEQQLFGLLPDSRNPIQYWFLLDVDGPDTGISDNALIQLGVPGGRPKGVDVVIDVLVEGGEAVAQAWGLERNQLVSINVRPTIATLVMHPHFSELNQPRPNITPKREGFPVHDVVHVELSSKVAGVVLDKPFLVQALIVDENKNLVDKLDDEDRGFEFVLENPSFPHCFGLNDVGPGGVLKVEIEKLRPNAGIHAFLGPREVFTGKSDSRGGGIIEIPIPKDVTQGYHLLTVGVDKTALTADCLVNIRDQRQGSGTRIEDAIDSNNDFVINDAEILNGVRLWITGDILPETGRAISDAEILQLIKIWITGESTNPIPPQQAANSRSWWDDVWTAITDIF